MCNVCMIVSKIVCNSLEIYLGLAQQVLMSLLGAKPTNCKLSLEKYNQLLESLAGSCCCIQFMLRDKDMVSFSSSVVTMEYKKNRV